jgi:hypothetical protein
LFQIGAKGILHLCCILFCLMWLFNFVTLSADRRSASEESVCNLADIRFFTSLCSVLNDELKFSVYKVIKA